MENEKAAPEIRVDRFESPDHPEHRLYTETDENGKTSIVALPGLETRTEPNLTPIMDDEGYPLCIRQPGDGGANAGASED